MKLKITLIIISTFLISLNSQRAYSQKTPTKKELRKARPNYIKTGFGISASKFRDFATSPLFYQGSILPMSMAFVKSDTLREMEVGGELAAGFFSTNFNEDNSNSIMGNLNLSFLQLYKLPVLSSKKLNTKIGFMVDNTLVVRMNKNLMNNSLGVDIFSNILFSLKLKKDISRKAKQKKFLFIKYKKKAKQRNLTFGVNIGAINTTFRNGYIYADQSALLNKITPFGNHELHMFSGLRLKTEVSLSRLLKNKNIVQYSYIWNAYKTAGFDDNFEIAHHIFKISLLFNTNNK